MPVVALVDTNCDPDEADYVIPGNDDAIRSCNLIAKVIADAIEQGKQKIAVKEFKPAATNGAEAAPEAEAPVSDTEAETPVPDTEAEAPVSDTEAASDTPAEEVPANDS
jgi:small subunit ribosomal protein S2